MDLRERNERQGQRHPWERARTQFFLDVLRRDGALARARAVLDVGAGDAWFAAALAAALEDARVTCWDAHYAPEDIAALAGARVQATSARPQTQHDLVVLLDVLEHVEDDRGFLQDIVQNLLSPGGTALISVPAWQSLFSAHDVNLAHHRRYAPAACRALLAEAGLTEVMGGGLFSSLLLPRAAGVAVEKLRGLGARKNGARPPALGDWQGGPLMTSILSTVLELEGRGERALAERGIEIPGLSFWALCRRSA